jgi:molybdenum cofactor guanylyltransferase
VKGLNGLVLAGGESVRMGSDKSLIEFHGRPQRDFLFNLLKKFCEKVYTSCRKNSTIPESLNPLCDKFNIRGPFNGILTAFETHPHEAWLTVPVDMPFINEEAIHFLLSKRDSKFPATCFFDSEGKFPEPLFTVWETAAYPFLTAFFKEGKTRPREFLMTHEVNVIKSPFPKLHVNINSPDDLERFKTTHHSS